MKFNRTNKQAITHDIYKVCDGEQTKEITGGYRPTSTWQPEDILKTISEACLQRTSLENLCESQENLSADTVQKRINELELDQIDQLINGWINDQIGRLHFHGNTKLTISVDFHQQPYYDDPSPNCVIGMKRKKRHKLLYLFLISLDNNQQTPLSDLYKISDEN